jgi:hypothetical protein
MTDDGRKVSTLQFIRCLQLCIPFNPLDLGKQARKWKNCLWQLAGLREKPWMMTSKGMGAGKCD